MKEAMEILLKGVLSRLEEEWYDSQWRGSFEEWLKCHEPEILERLLGNRND